MLVKDIGGIHLTVGCLLTGTGIEIYDLAGHPEYYSSHSAVIESLCLESPAVFVQMLDLTKPKSNCPKKSTSGPISLK